MIELVVIGWSSEVVVSLGTLTATQGRRKRIRVCGERDEDVSHWLIECVTLFKKPHQHCS